MYMIECPMEFKTESMFLNCNMYADLYNQDCLLALYNDLEAYTIEM